MSDFNLFSQAVKAKFDSMKELELFRVTATKDELWSTYLTSFPAGTNPVFKERTEHDCQCCKSFIRAVGDVVAVVDGKITSIWDVEVPNFYQDVSNKMSELVRTKAIENKFFHFEGKAGNFTTFSDKDGKVLTWNHFQVDIPKNKIMKLADQGSFLGQQRATFDVLFRSLTTLTMDSLDTVLELISQNSLYRGEEHKFAVESFKRLKVEFDRIKGEPDRINYAWVVATSKAPESVLRIRNTAIGTLLISLSEGEDLESSVGKFEAMVAPQNYKRPTALVTKKMIDDAKKTITTLDLESSLDRRYAVIEDISVNNILFVDRSAKPMMKDNIFDKLASEVAVAPSKNFDKVEEIHIDKFVQDILPKAESIEVMVENKHTGNLVSLIAPANEESKNMFKWNNKFSWTYAGEVTDSIKERVKRAGGKVDGDIRCSLSWYNYDDLDLHMREPGGNEIYYGSKTSHNRGQLDVDMNAGCGQTRQPVENIYYLDRKFMAPGTYTLFVEQFSQREKQDIGFEVEIEFDGNPVTMSHDKEMRSKERVMVASFELSKGGVLKMNPMLDSTTKSKDIWGIKTNTYQRVTTIMNSPNHWDGHGVGNKHYFFMLENCKNEGKARGFYNEFLSEDLNKHRKVLEIVGSKMRTEESDRQLSGLGFSSTQRNHVMVRVKGNFTRTLKVLF